MTTQYEPFELIVGYQNGEGYPITVKQSPNGHAEAISQLNPFASEIQDVIWNLKNVDAKLDSFMKIGKYLFNNLFVEEVASNYRQSISITQGQNKRLRLLLYIQAPELAVLPWEYLYDDKDKFFLAIRPRISLTRHIPLSKLPNVVQSELPLRILVVISNPNNIISLDLDEEKRIIEDELTDVQRKNQVELHFVEHATVKNINHAMREFKPHIFHFIGHSSSTEDETTISLVNDVGGVKTLTENVFSEFFSTSQEITLVILNSCESGVLSPTERQAGMPYHISQLGVPAVIAMQYPMPNEASYIFAREFYHTLGTGESIEAAVAEARKALYQEKDGKGCEWGIPVLFLRAKDELLLPPLGGISLISELDIFKPLKPSHPQLNKNFVGRAVELEDLMAAMQGQRTQLVIGMTGIGKSELVAQFAYKKLEIEPDRIFWYKFRQSSDLEDSFIWKLANFLAWHGEENLWQKVSHLAENNQQLPSQSMMLSHAVQVLQRGNYLICLDDFQTVDELPDIQNFVEELQSTVSNSELKLIVISQRTPAFIRNMNSQRLHGLTVEDTALLLNHRNISLTHKLVDTLHNRIEGNAEMLILAADILYQSSDPERQIQLIDQADSIANFLVNKVKKFLNDEQQKIMEVISILHDGATLDAIETIFKGHNVRDNLALLIDRSLLSSELGKTQYEYVQHAMLRSYYYESLDNELRLEIHRQAAIYYSQDVSDRFKALFHYQKISDHAEIAKLLDGNIWSLTHYGNLHALYDLLTDFGDESIPSEQRVVILIAKAQLDGYTGKIDSAIQNYNEAESALRFLNKNGSKKLRKKYFNQQNAQIARGMAFILSLEKPHEALGHIDRGLKYVGKDPSAKADLLTLQGGTLRKLGKMQEALKALQKARSIQDPLMETPQLLKTLLTLGNHYYYLGQLEKSQNILHKAEKVGKKLHDYVNLLAIRNSLAACLQGLGENEKAAKLYRDTIDTAIQSGSIREQVTLHLSYGAVLIQLQEFDEAHAQLNNALRAAPPEKFTDSVVTIHIHLALLYLEALDRQYLRWGIDTLSKAEEEINIAMQLVKKNKFEYQMPTIHCLKARLHLARGEFVEATIEANCSQNLARKQEMVVEEGQALRALGQILTKQERFDESIEKFQESLRCLQNNPDELSLTLEAMSIIEQIGDK